jgi:hypothetical protein
MIHSATTASCEARRRTWNLSGQSRACCHLHHFAIGGWGRIRTGSLWSFKPALFLMSFPTVNRQAEGGSRKAVGQSSYLTRALVPRDLPSCPPIASPLPSAFRLLHLPSAFLLENWSPRRDLNSHKTLTAGVALPLSYAGSYRAAGKTRNCMDELRKLAPAPFGHASAYGGALGNRTLLTLLARQSRHLGTWRPIFKSGSRESNSDAPAPKAGGFPSSLDPENGCGGRIRTGAFPD